MLRINVVSRTGMALAQEYGVSAVPTFIVFDGQGRVVYIQVGLPDRAAIRAAVAGSGRPQ